MVTVAEVLAEPSLRLTALYVADPAADVRWVATSELTDPGPFLEGGELLLTTGLETRGWRTQWDGYVRRLVGSGVAALGIGTGTGLTHARPPAALVRACGERGLTLFEVPRQTTFVAVSRVTAGLLERGEQAAARDAVRMQRALTEAALQHDDGGALPQRLAALVEGAVCTLTRDGQPDRGPFGPAAAELDLDDVRAEVLRIRPHGLRAGSSRSLEAGRTVVVPLGLRGRPESYLAVFTPGRPSEGQRSAVTTAVALLSLAVESRIDRRATERRLRGRALDLVLSADAGTARVVLAALRGTDPEQVSLPARLQVLRATGSTDSLDDALGSLEEESSPVRELSARLGDELWVAVSPRRSAGLADDLAAAGLRVGVGSAEAVEDAASSHEVAGRALRETTTSAPVVRWDELVRGGPLALLGRAEAAAFASSFLGPLAGSGELLETLAAFLRHHGSRGAVAEELGVHRNTVRNRVGQIEAALGRSLDDPQTRVNAWIALQAGAVSGGSAHQ